MSADVDVWAMREWHLMLLFAPMQVFTHGCPFDIVANNLVIQTSILQSSKQPTFKQFLDFHCSIYSKYVGTLSECTLLARMVGATLQEYFVYSTAIHTLLREIDARILRLYVYPSCSNWQIISFWNRSYLLRCWKRGQLDILAVLKKEPADISTEYSGGGELCYVSCKPAAICVGA